MSKSIGILAVLLSLVTPTLAGEVVDPEAGGYLVGVPAQAQARPIQAHPEDTLYGINFVTSPNNTLCMTAKVTGAREVYIDWDCVNIAAAAFVVDPDKAMPPENQWNGLAVILKAVHDGTAKEVVRAK